MDVFRDITELRPALRRLRRDGKLAFVPTMGNLHAGHLGLVREAKKHSAHVAVSIFVNPLQFGPNEDLDSYPRTFDADCEALAGEGVSVLFSPTAETIYPVPLSQQTRVSVPVISERYCGASRPGHFDGVATVVCKLFNIVQPDVAVFGRKDYQQLAIIRRMVRDLAMPVDIVGLDTVREADGLAMSSRNQYLDADERRKAPLLHRTLLDAAGRVEKGERNYQALCREMEERLNGGGFRSDYFEIADADTLLSPQTDARAVVILAAAWLGAARLIDNIEIPFASP